MLLTHTIVVSYMSNYCYFNQVKITATYFKGTVIFITINTSFGD